VVGVSKMQKGSTGMGMRKHRTAGHPGKGPKFRLWEKIEAEKDERKKRLTKMYNSVKEAFSRG